MPAQWKPDPPRRPCNAHALVCGRKSRACRIPRCAPPLARAWRCRLLPGAPETARAPLQQLCNTRRGKHGFFQQLVLAHLVVREQEAAADDGHVGHDLECGCSVWSSEGWQGRGHSKQVTAKQVGHSGGYAALQLAPRHPPQGAVQFGTWPGRKAAPELVHLWRYKAASALCIVWHTVNQGGSNGRATAGKHHIGRLAHFTCCCILPQVNAIPKTAIGHNHAKLVFLRYCHGFNIAHRNARHAYANPDFDY